MKNIQTPLTYNPACTGLIGVSQQDITPPLGIYSRNWGAALTDVAIGTHLPLILTCMVIFPKQRNNSQPPLVLFSADLGWWKDASDERLLRESILQSIDVPETHLLFCLSHTHAGPSLSSGDYDKPGGRFIAPYKQMLHEKAVDTYHEACKNAVSATLSWHYGKCDLATNRDMPIPENDRVLVGFNPTIPADDTLLVGKITDESGYIIGTLVNYACHPTVLAWDNQLLSPDYVGAMRSLVEEKTKAPCLFLQGASGELAPPEQYVGDTALADKHGRHLGYSVLATLESMYSPHTQLYFDKLIESGAPLAIWKRKHRIPSDVLRAECIPIEMGLKAILSMEEIDRQLETCTDHVLRERLVRMKAMRKNLGKGDTVIVPLWIWRLGEACIVAQPNEAYSHFQQLLREEFTPIPIVVVNIANGYIGYLPPSNEYNKDMYAVTQTPFAKGSLEHLTKKAAEAILDIMK